MLKVRFSRMKVNIKIVLLIFIGFLVSGINFGNGNIIPDTIQIDSRRFDPEKIEYYVQKRNYNYDKNPQYEQNIIRRWWLSFLQKIKESIGRDNIQITWNIAKVLIIMVGLGILIHFLMRSNKSRVFKRSDSSPDYNQNLIKSENAKEDLSRLIEKYENNRSYNEALRYRYIDTLRLLNDQGIIDWRDYKTNENFISEITDPIISKDFEALSHIFEYVVYGDFAIGSGSYYTYKQLFTDFYSLIQKLTND